MWKAIKDFHQRRFFPKHRCFETTYLENILCSCFSKICYSDRGKLPGSCSLNLSILFITIIFIHFSASYINVHFTYCNGQELVMWLPDKTFIKCFLLNVDFLLISHYIPEKAWTLEVIRTRFQYKFHQ